MSRRILHYQNLPVTTSVSSGIYIIYDDTVLMGFFSGLLQGHNREDCDIMLSHFKLAYRMLDFNRNAGEIIIELKDKESFERAKGVNGQVCVL